ncbi:hypothetical protein JXQ31_07875 [candidate division KSB1 bacterium]|nr:hypothetical protein [candidate division KSB1 bacterium]
MNLIFDKREKENDHVDKDHLHNTVPTEKKDEPFIEDNLIKPKRIKKKGLPAGFFYFIIVPLIVMSLVVLYMFYFKKDMVLKYKNQILSPKSGIVDTTGQQPTISGRDIEQPSDTTKIVSPVAVQDAPENVTTRIIGVLVNNLTPELKLSTLYLDENTFSAQMRTNSQGDLENLYSQFNSLPDNIKIDSTPTITNSQALISGTFSIPQRSASETPVKSFNRGTFESELSELLLKNNTRKVEFSLGPNQSWNNKTRALAFIKIEGSISSCQQFVNDFLSSGWDLTVSKIILMPSNEQSAIMVLRVFIHNPV